MRLNRAVVFAVLFTALVGTTAPAAVSVEASPAPAAVVGQGFGEVLACAACIAGGIILASGGVAAVLVAANTPGSAIVVAGCIAACAAALS